ncbi:MAG: PrsW family glutamic-type intramembrane protease [Bacteroidales bacterium]|nr:PrsW family glutamic-type intramembrane protease [Bacteroidales bacterium]
MDPLLFISILPVVILLIYIYKKDKNEREPLGLLLKTFGCGILTAIILLVFGVIKKLYGFEIFAFANDSAILKSFLQAAIPEEGLKFLFLYLVIWNNREFNEHFDGIVYAVFLSMGFACLENILYVFNGGWETGVARALLAVPGHFLFAVIMGYFFSLARFSPMRRRRYMLRAILYPILAHGIYDSLCFLEEMYGDRLGLTGIFVILLLAFDIILWRAGLKAIR